MRATHRIQELTHDYKVCRLEIAKLRDIWGEVWEGPTWSFVPSLVELVCHSSWYTSVFTSQVASLSVGCPQFYLGSWRSPIPHFLTEFVMKGCWVYSVIFPHQLRWCSINVVYHLDWFSYIEPPLYSGINPWIWFAGILVCCVLFWFVSKKFAHFSFWPIG